ncbi:DEAD/DEAH box helicase family protein [Botrimarina sp.]|uniref:BPTD_3080 family restriction endonuclease n=1 Tax=Botrimarina sp. TaxID=2795802 RepID=UPI0032EC1D92
MSNPFFDQPILNSPYEYPTRHWELDEEGQPTQQIVEKRRPAEFVTPIPKAKKRKRSRQQELGLDDDADLESEVSTAQQQYAKTAELVNDIRAEVDAWRKYADAKSQGVTPETARLLDHWRNHAFSGVRPFFCQVEAVETVIWLTEVAPKTKKGQDFLARLEQANDEANPGLDRLALKLATGAGKTTVMAMLIAWQTINAVRRPGSKRYTRGFLVVAPGLTIKDRLRVLQPNDPDSYYESRELVPTDLMRELGKAKIVITNYHAFKLRERMELSKGTRALLEGRGEELQTLETEGQMIQRVMPDLMGIKNVMVLNDEAHHCYREKPGDPDEDDALDADEKEDAKENAEAARMWISGLEAVQRKLGLLRVIDLSATPFFLRGSGYAEGTLFPWTMTDFSLMDAIECGIVKLPRVPVSDNVASSDVPIYRNLWTHIRKKMPKKGRGKATRLDPLKLPPELETALAALYGHYEKTFHQWREEGIDVPPCFIVVCNNTAASKLVHDYISGFDRENSEGETEYIPGRLELFRNYDQNGQPLARPRTLLIDSHQLESGEALDKNFREAAAVEIERFRDEIIERTRDAEAARNLTEADLLREVMNTVGKKGRLGEQIRCVVSVSMLTEGWDANTVTHILGVRAFKTQLLCEQVIGRALRRQSYDVNDSGLFDVEYADILGIPFDFTAKPVVAKPKPPRPTVHVRAVSPERDACRITFPRVEGYRVELPEERIEATFGPESTLELTTDLTGPTEARNQGIVGEAVDLNLIHTGKVRTKQVAFEIAKLLVENKFRDSNDQPKHHLYFPLVRVAQDWIENHLVCRAGTFPAQLMHRELANMAVERIAAGIVTRFEGERPIKAILDPYNPTGSTSNVRFNTSKTLRWQTDSRKCHVDWAICDSTWEQEFCRLAEQHPRVFAYVKNHNLGFEVPYLYGNVPRRYLPDFLLLVDDGRGRDDPLHLVVEVKGYRGEDAVAKKLTMDTYWVPGVNNLGDYGRWAFYELTNILTMKDEFAERLENEFRDMIAAAGGPKES